MPMSSDPWQDVRLALARAPRTLDDRRLKRSAVAAMIDPDRRVWFMKRASHPSDPWSGHLSFPGGREEAQDATLLHTAKRETCEEVGVDLDHAELLGQLDDIQTRPLRTLMIRPFVFALPQTPGFTLNHEVQHMVSQPLDALLANEGRGTMRWPRGVGMKLGCVDFAGERLWGLTLAIVDDLLHQIDQGGQGVQRAG